MSGETIKGRLIRGMHPNDRALFLKLSSTLAMAATTMMAMGASPEETMPYFGMLKEAKERFGTDFARPSLVLTGEECSLLRQMLEPVRPIENIEGIKLYNRLVAIEQNAQAYEKSLSPRVHENPLGLTATDKGDKIVN